MTLKDWVKFRIFLTSGQTVELVVSARAAEDYEKSLALPYDVMHHVTFHGIRHRPLVNNTRITLQRYQIAGWDIEDNACFLYTVKPNSLEAVADGSEVLAEATSLAE